MRTRHFVVLLAVCTPFSVPSLASWRVFPANSYRASGGPTAQIQPIARIAPPRLAVNRTDISSTRLPVAVNGADTPAKISDHLAYRHFIAAVSIGAAASTKDIAGRDALLSRVGLSPDDRTRFTEAIRNLKDELVRVETARRQWAPSADQSRSVLTELKARRDLLLDRAAADVSLSLSADGRERLRTFVREHVKRRIVVYGGPPSLTH